jgi:hypothetical protein
MQEDRDALHEGDQALYVRRVEIVMKLDVLPRSDSNLVNFWKQAK